MKRFNDELKFNRTWHCVKLPFREHHEILSDNFQNSETLLVQLLNKLNSDLLVNYDEIIKIYEKENIIEKIETVGKPSLVHYLPIVPWSRMNVIRQRLALYLTHHQK